MIQSGENVFAASSHEKSRKLEASVSYSVEEVTRPHLVNVNVEALTGESSAEQEKAQVRISWNLILLPVRTPWKITEGPDAPFVKDEQRRQKL